MKLLRTGRYLLVFALLLIGANAPIYSVIGRRLVADADLVGASYLVVLALTLTFVTFCELRKWRLRPDNDPFYDPTANRQAVEEPQWREAASTR